MNKQINFIKERILRGFINPHRPTSFQVESNCVWIKQQSVNLFEVFDVRWIYFTNNKQQTQQ